MLCSGVGEHDERLWKLLLSNLFSPDLSVARLVQEGVCALVCSSTDSRALHTARFFVEQASSSYASSPDFLTAAQQRWACLLCRLIGSGNASLQRYILDSFLKELDSSNLRPMQALLLSNLCYERLDIDLRKPFCGRLIRFCRSVLDRAQDVGPALEILSGLAHSFDDPRPVLGAEGPHIVSALMSLLCSSKLYGILFCLTTRPLIPRPQASFGEITFYCYRCVCISPHRLEPTATRVGQLFELSTPFLTWFQLFQKLVDLYRSFPLIRSSLIDLIRRSARKTELQSALKGLVATAMANPMEPTDAKLLLDALEVVPTIRLAREQIRHLEVPSDSDETIDNMCRDADELILALDKCDRDDPERISERLASRVHELQQLINRNHR
jgi:hypothetical protein